MKSALRPTLRMSSGDGSLLLAGLEVLLGEPRADPSKVAAIGYCFGGTMVLELARADADLSAVVGFQPGLATASPQDASNITGKVLVCCSRGRRDASGKSRSGKGVPPSLSATREWEEEDWRWTRV